MRNINLLLGVCICVGAIALGGCSKGTTNSPPVTNDKPQNSPPTASPVARNAGPRSSNGDAIDTSKLDAEITNAEGTYQQKPTDDEARVALAHGYLARAKALTKARQYSSALGDYRRTLKYDPQNKEAFDMSATIISIFKSLGRDAPAEGQEPPPLPFSGNETKNATAY